jgi:hypothetical protein
LLLEHSNASRFGPNSVRFEASFSFKEGECLSLSSAGCKVSGSPPRYGSFVLLEQAREGNIQVIVVIKIIVVVLGRAAGARLALFLARASPALGALSLCRSLLLCRRNALLLLVWGGQIAAPHPFHTLTLSGRPSRSIAAFLLSLPPSFQPFNLHLQPIARVSARGHGGDIARIETPRPRISLENVYSTRGRGEIACVSVDVCGQNHLTPPPSNKLRTNCLGEQFLAICKLTSRRVTFHRSCGEGGRGERGVCAGGPLSEEKMAGKTCEMPREPFVSDIPNHVCHRSMSQALSESPPPLPLSSTRRFAAWPCSGPRQLAHVPGD